MSMAKYADPTIVVVALVSKVYRLTFRFNFVSNCPCSQCLSQDLDFFSPKKELFNFFRELFAKERSYPSTTKLHDESRKQVRRLYTTCTEYVKTRYSSIINYVIIWSTCKWRITPMPFEKKTIFVTEKEIICKKTKKTRYLYQTKTLQFVKMTLQ